MTQDLGELYIYGIKIKKSDNSTYLDSIIDQYESSEIEIIRRPYWKKIYSHIKRYTYDLLFHIGNNSRHL